MSVLTAELQSRGVCCICGNLRMYESEYCGENDCRKYPQNDEREKGGNAE